MNTEQLLQSLLRLGMSGTGSAALGAALFLAGMALIIVGLTLIATKTCAQRQADMELKARRARELENQD